MVQITPLLSVIPLLAHFTSADSTSNGIAVRQSFDSSSLPSECQSPCEVVNTMTDCGAGLDCMCTDTIGSQLEQCMSCLVSAEPTVESEAEGAISSWNEACDGNLSLSGSSGSSGTTGGTTSGTTGGTTSGTTGSTTTSGTVPATTTGTASGGSALNPLGAPASGTVGLKTGSMAVCIVAALAGAFMSF